MSDPTAAPEHGDPGGGDARRVVWIVVAGFAIGIGYLLFIIAFGM